MIVSLVTSIPTFNNVLRNLAPSASASKTSKLHLTSSVWESHHNVQKQLQCSIQVAKVLVTILQSTKVFAMIPWSANVRVIILQVTKVLAMIPWNHESNHGDSANHKSGCDDPAICEGKCKVSLSHKKWLQWYQESQKQPQWFCNPWMQSWWFHSHKSTWNTVVSFDCNLNDSTSCKSTCNDSANCKSNCIDSMIWKCDHNEIGICKMRLQCFPWAAKSDSNYTMNGESIATMTQSTNVIAMKLQSTNAIAMIPQIVIAITIPCISKEFPIDDLWNTKGDHKDPTMPKDDWRVTASHKIIHNGTGSYESDCNDAVICKCDHDDSTSHKSTCNAQWIGNRIMMIPMIPQVMKMLELLLQVTKCSCNHSKNCECNCNDLANCESDHDVIASCESNRINTMTPWLAISTMMILCIATALAID